MAFKSVFKICSKQTGDTRHTLIGRYRFAADHALVRWIKSNRAALEAYPFDVK